MEQEVNKRFTRGTVASKIERLSASIAAVAITLSIVWGMSSYAYPGAPGFAADLMATAVQIKT